MSPLLRASVMGVVLLALAVPPSLATQMIHLDTRALVRGSEDIVIGQVEQTRPYWNASHTKIFTAVEVRVSESLKGAPGGSITLTQLGGEVDGFRYSVPGSPVFAPGEEALLFVWRDPQGRAQVNGLAQGKFDIRRDAATGERTVQRALPGLAVRDARTLSLVPEGQPVPPLRLSELVREIRRAIADDQR